ncbi:MAG: non-canonical purine NTP diphosphatase [Paludibacteraceae bacterium]|nr:non-canonical purine NTP diphosphatase [Paludibacteraceae bacterium]
MDQIIFVTHNKHKSEEIKNIIGNSFEIKNLSDINITEEIPETGNTLKENALQKAKYLHDKLGYNCFADDTGLEVDSLNGEPGVYSARYAGEPTNSQRNIEKLLHNLKGKENRNAQFRTVIAVILDNKTYFFEGSIAGQIIDTQRGDGGFGYDSVFIPNGYDKTFAELPAEVKNSISHRAMAMQKFKEFINNLK